MADIVVTLTSNSTPSPQAAQASSEFDSDYAAWKAFDGDAGTYWSTSASPLPCWIWYSFGSGNPKTLLGYAITARSDAADGAPRTWVFQGWNGSSWDDLDTQADVSWSTGETKTFTLASAASYSAFQISISENNGRSTTNIAQIALIGALVVPSGGLSLSPSAPAVAPAPGSQNLTVTTAAPVATKGLAVYPTAGSLTFTTSEPYIFIPLQPTTGLMEITPGVPTLETFFHFNLTLDLPTFAFAGETSRILSMGASLPALVSSFAAGSTSTFTLPEIAFAGEFLPGTVGTFDLSLPHLESVFSAGAKSSLSAPALTFGGTALPGTVGVLNIRMPVLTGLFSGQSTQPGVLSLSLPALRGDFGLSAESLSALSLALPALSGAFEGYAGQVWSFDLGLPELDFSGVLVADTHSDIALTLPALEALIEASGGDGRFDYLLYWRRPS